MTRQGKQLAGLRGTASVVAAGALLLWGIVGRFGGVGAGAIEGNYTVKVAGYATGKGTCAVDAKSVQVDCQIDDDGSTDVLTANLKRDQNRFKGDGTLDGVHVQISGRVDPPDQSTTNTRISVTFVSDDGRSGRVVGIHD